jgi:U32 family peptidase
VWIEVKMSDYQRKDPQIELLAPAGDWDALKAGIAAGADAVYLGGKAFSARQNAVNFDLPEVKEVADLLHLHGKKIYVTVNTLIADSELENALKYLNELYNLGVDAVIVQDIGLIDLTRKYLPRLEIHASTQMTVHNSEGAAYLKGLGVKRVVLARELTRDEVAAIVAGSGIEVEVFVHGAICVCYSGQCLMSSMIGGRSGNRGRCAQPCRMEYQLLQGGKAVKTQGSFLLSPKDLALCAMIPELFKAGVNTLKIEGRMKRPEYVYSVVKVYRRLLDRYFEEPARFQVEGFEIQELEEAFNRGFTTGYFGGNRNFDLMGFTRPNNRGVYLGRVRGVDRVTRQISLELEANLAEGDEVEVWVSQGGRTTGVIRNLRKGIQPISSAGTGEKVDFAMGGRVNPGDRVFKVFSSRLDLETKQALDKENPALKIPCRVEVNGRLDSPLELIYWDTDGNQGTASTAFLLQSAKNRPLTTETLWEQLGRLGNTPLQMVDLSSNLSENLMVPLSELNQARRHAVEELIQCKLSPFQREPVKLPKLDFSGGREVVAPSYPGKTILSVWVADLPGVKAAAEAGADLIYAGGDEMTGFHWNESAFQEAIAGAHLAGARLVVGLPRINREGQRAEWESSLRIAMALESDGIMVSDPGSLSRVMAESDRTVFLNYPVNIFNRAAVGLFSHSRVKQLTLSPELSLKQIVGLFSGKLRSGLEILIQGPLELMVSEYCPIHSTASNPRECGNLCQSHPYYFKDRLGLDFPIYTDQFCRMHLLNCKDLCLYGDLAKLLELPPLVLRLELKTFSARAVRLLVEAYRQGLQDVREGRRIREPDQVIEEFKSLTGRGITRGHYFRGVE